MDFARYKVLTFDCYGTLIDWEAGISNLLRSWQGQIGPSVPDDLVLSAFALRQAKHQQTQPALIYPDVLRRTWRDIEETFGFEHSAARGELFAAEVGNWPPFADTVESLRYLSRFYKFAILSNVDNASLARTLKRLEVPFLLTVTAEDVGAYKPNLAHFDAAFARLAQMGISRDQVLHVAQSKHHDIQPARKLGLDCVWVNRRHGKKGSGATIAAEAEPDLTVASLAELVDRHKRATSAVEASAG
ncbi:MAG TPA: HAD-IA family hydrolase [Pseudolabrys sp.]|nr:HAD-IA family hydrolase [Pseudolabrys sp.]